RTSQMKVNPPKESGRRMRKGEVVRGHSLCESQYLPAGRRRKTVAAARTQSGAMPIMLLLDPSFSKEEHVLRESLRKDLRKARGIMACRQRYTPFLCVLDRDFGHATLVGNSPQVDGQEGGDMSRVVDVLKGVEASFGNQGHDAQDAELVWRGHDDPPVRFREAHQLAHERSRILEVLDRLR